MRSAHHRPQTRVVRSAQDRLWCKFCTDCTECTFPKQQQGSSFHSGASRNQQVLKGAKMGLCGKITKYLLFVTIPLAAVLVFFHLECSKEKEEAFRNKFNDVYNPEATDCSAALHFFNGDLLTLNIGFQNYILYFASLISILIKGPEFFLVQWIPCSVSKLIEFISMRLGKTGVQYLSISHQTDF